MTSQKAHYLLSDLHKLLAAYEPIDFTEAGAFSHRLQPALQLLSTMTGNWSEPPVNDTHDSNSFLSVDAKNSSAGTKLNSRDLQSSSTQIEHMINKTHFAESAASLTEMIKRFDLDIRVGSKDGKQRLIQRIAREIAKQPKTSKSRLLAELKKMAGSQTHGWIEVLKSSK